eukprot:GILJ01008778.1.p1 GENE.GILJ01008778.1~~GILJ01008778.1.p1  ORF type:complete len:616 (-),score=78.98 GILJ01008778.1:257-2104(-)
MEAFAGLSQHVTPTMMFAAQGFQEPLAVFKEKDVVKLAARKELRRLNSGNDRPAKKSKHKKCSVMGCEEDHFSRGYCLAHHREFARNERQGARAHENGIQKKHEENGSTSIIKPPLTPHLSLSMGSLSDPSVPAAMPVEPTNSVPATPRTLIAGVQVARQLSEMRRAYMTTAVTGAPAGMAPISLPLESVTNSLSALMSPKARQLPRPSPRASQNHIVHKNVPLFMELAKASTSSLFGSSPRTSLVSPRHSNFGFSFVPIPKPKPVKTAVYYSEKCLLHETLPTHFEQPGRITAILQTLQNNGHFLSLEWSNDIPNVDPLDCFGVHDPAYLDSISMLSECVEKGTVKKVCIDPPDNDTFISPGTRQALLSAAGTVTKAVDDVMTGRLRNVFCAVRPPGHHAEHARANGFCIINNVAIGAFHAKRVHKLDRIAMIDWDVHHGNGIEEFSRKNNPENFFYASVFRGDIFPHRPEEVMGTHNVLTLPTRQRAGRHGFRKEMLKVFDQLRHFNPQLIFISAGFDGHKDEWQGHNIGLVEKDFEFFTAEIMAIAADCCEDRIVSVLEGGYNLESMPRCVAAHVSTLMIPSDQLAELRARNSSPDPTSRLSPNRYGGNSPK